MLKPEDILKVVRSDYPNKVTQSTLTELVRYAKIVGYRKFKRMRITGGLVYDMLKGFHEEPYSLAIETGFVIEYEKMFLNSVIVENTKVLGCYDTLSPLRRIWWKFRVACFNRLAKGYR